MNNVFSNIVSEYSNDSARSIVGESQTLQDIRTHIETGTQRTAISLIHQLHELEYEQNRSWLAKALGMRPGALDKIRHKQLAENSTDKLQGRALELAEIVPASEPQEGATLLNDVAAQIRRFVVADATSIDAITLWIVFTHLAQDAAVSPILAITSATKASGKSTLLDVVSRLVPKPLPTANISVSALFRTVEMLVPTLLIDEADSMFRSSDDLRTLVNSGFSKSASYVIRTVGDNFEPRMFSVYCPKTISLIGSLPDTIESRSIIIRMRRRLPSEPIERLRSDVDQGFKPLAARIARWIADNKQAIFATDPSIPESLSDRQADSWRELLRIADTAGGDWPERARAAAIELCGRQADDTDLSIKLLSDIQQIFEANPERQKWPAQALVDALNALEEAPWAEINHGRNLTAARLARMLARFDVKTKVFKLGTGTFRGYSTDSFTDVFSRYLQKKCNLLPNDTNSLQNNELQGYRKVTVTNQKCNHDVDAETEEAEDPLLHEQVTDSKCNRNQSVTDINTYDTTNYSKKVTGYTSTENTESTTNAPVDWPAVLRGGDADTLGLF